VSVSGLMRRCDIGAASGWRDIVRSASSEILADGGSCIAGPDGQCVVQPMPPEEGLEVAVLDHRRVREERHNFDLAGHYARPDVMRLEVNRQRQTLPSFSD
jgi:nitrilase